MSTPKRIKLESGSVERPPVEPHDPQDEPLGDGWFRRPNGEKYRPVPHGYMGSSMEIDDEPAPQRPNGLRSFTWDDERRGR